MFDCKVCGRHLKNYTLRSVSSHFGSNKCLRITNDLWLERDLLLQKIEKGDGSFDTFKKHKEADELYKEYIKFKRDVRQEFYDARLKKWKTVRGLNN